MSKKGKGKLIVLDGSDGSGKATQTRFLIDRLKKEGCLVETLDFPQYGKNFFGTLIGQCLAGVHGDFVSIDPHIGSVLYAADRFESKTRIEKWLKSGHIVVLDRYVSSNQIHQGGKIGNAKKQKQFLQWLDTMEHGVFGIPRPDLIVYLDVPSDVSQRLLQSKDMKQKKVYLKKGQRDIVEENMKHLSESRANALKLVKKLNHWTKIDCTKKGDLLSRELIAEKVWKEVTSIL